MVEYVSFMMLAMCLLKGLIECHTWLNGEASAIGNGLSGLVVEETSAAELPWLVDDTVYSITWSVDYCAGSCEAVKLTE